MRQECHHKVEDVLFERDRLQGRLGLAAPQLSGVLISLTTACEQLEKHCGHLASSCVWLECLLASLVYGLVDRVACLVTVERTAHCARLTDIFLTVSESLDLEWRYIFKQSTVAEREGECLQLTQRHLERLLLCPWFQVSTDVQAVHAFWSSKLSSLAFRHYHFQ